MAKKIQIKVNPRAGKELAKQIEKNAAKKGIKLDVDARKLQKDIEKGLK